MQKQVTPGSTLSSSHAGIYSNVSWNAGSISLHVSLHVSDFMKTNGCFLDMYTIAALTWHESGLLDLNAVGQDFSNSFLADVDYHVDV